jgi:integrase
VNPIVWGSNGQDGRRPEHGPIQRHKRLPWVPFDEVWEEFVRRVMANEDARTKAMILLAYDVALRREELMSLRVDNIDWARRIC